MRKIIINRTRTEAFIAILGAVFIITSYVIAVTVHISPAYDTSMVGAGFITTENGGRFENNWDNWQLAFDDLIPDGGWIKFPTFNYSADKTIYWNGSGNLELIGSAPYGGNKDEWGCKYNCSTTVNIVSDLPEGTIKINGYKTDSSGRWCNGVTIHNIGIHGGNDNVYDVYHAYGINVTCCSDLLLNNVELSYINGIAVYLNWTYAPSLEYVSIDHCGNYTRNEPAIALYPYDYQGSWSGDILTTPSIRRCVIEPCRYMWLDSDVSRDCVRRLIFSENYCEATYNESADHGTHSPYYGMIIGSHSDIHDNSFHGYTNYTFIYDGNSQYSRYNRVHDNSLYLGGGKDEIPCAQICLRQGDNWIITGNHNIESQGKGIFIGSNSKGHTIMGNEILNSAEYGLYITSSGNSIIGGNISGSGNSGIYLDGNDNTITGVNIFDNLVGIQIIGDDNCLGLCIITDNTNNGITLSTANNNTIGSLRVKNNGQYGIHIQNTCWNNSIGFVNALGNTGTNIYDQGHGTIKANNQE